MEPLEKVLLTDGEPVADKHLLEDADTDTVGDTDVDGNVD